LDGWRALSASMVLIGHFLGNQHNQKISRYPLLLSAIFHMILLISFTKWNATISAGVMEGFLCISCGVMTALNEDRFRAVARNIPAFVVLLLAAMLMLPPTFADLNEVENSLYQVLAVPPAIVLVLFFTAERQSWLRSMLLTRPIQGIGLTSYALYL
jgi:peptidoglycan/LPS O-acetylase OafA/YrhL